MSSVYRANKQFFAGRYHQKATDKRTIAFSDWLDTCAGYGFVIPFESSAQISDSLRREIEIKGKLTMEPGS